MGTLYNLIYDYIRLESNLVEFLFFGVIRLLFLAGFRRMVRRKLGP